MHVHQENTNVPDVIVSQSTQNTPGFLRPFQLEDWRTTHGSQSGMRKQWASGNASKTTTPSVSSVVAFLSIITSAGC